MGRHRLALVGAGTPPMRVGAIFPGQGSQTTGMGGDLAIGSPVAADLFACASRVLGYDLVRLVRDGPEEKLLETRYSQPAIFVTNYALAAVANERVTAVASAGHSFGEYCSLTLAGALAFDDAVALVNERGLAMQYAAELRPGAMAAVLGLDVESLTQVVQAAQAEGCVQLANFNTPAQIVVSGEVAAVRRAGELALEAGAKRVIPLNVSGAWHSELMAPALERFAPCVERTAIATPRFPVISNVDALPYLDAAHIRRNLILSLEAEVLWHATSLRLLEERLDLVVEFSASPVLAPMMKRLPGAPQVQQAGDLAAIGKLFG